MDRLLPKTKKYRMLWLLIIDIFVIVFASFMGLFIRFDFSYESIGEIYYNNVVSYTPIYLVTTVIVFSGFHMYRYLWSAAGLREAILITVACGISMLLQIAGMTFLGFNVPRSYYIICFVVLAILEMCVRFSYRIYRSFVVRYLHAAGVNDRILVVGAGDAGVAVLKEIRQSDRTEGKVMCFVDDDPVKKGGIIMGVPVEGNREMIPELVEKYNIQKIYIAIPTASGKDRKEIVQICQQTAVKDIRILPGIYEMINQSDDTISHLKKVSIDDLLGRDPIVVDLAEVYDSIKDKVVLVTGGGGSIGSELCRQIASHEPKLLVVVDIYENNIYDLQQELRLHNPEAKVEFLIGSVRNTHRMYSIFEQYRPQIVFHAAAHKHVPLMEDSPNEAIKNNVFGTYKVAKAAERYGTETFVLISTDKAVNPTNIMGASKRICEMIIQAKADRQRKIADNPDLATDKCVGKTKFVAVRFGNVLGSNGSVIPLFEKQIAEGGPVTVTHPDIIRYFMTIPEAVSLVLQASVYAKGGEIFVLDMGEPVKILDLAKNLIRLSGYEPETDIPIVFTGLRPGEKLYEEKLMDEEELKKTANNLIHIGKPIEMDYDAFFEKLDALNLASKADSEAIRAAVADMVPTYRRPEGEMKVEGNPAV